MTCNNTEGSFSCNCKSGFEKSGETCVGKISSLSLILINKLNENFSEIDKCSPFSCYPGLNCTNTTDGFECHQCPEGYEGDGIGPTGCKLVVSNTCGDGICNSTNECNDSCPEDCSNVPCGTIN